MVKVVKLKSSLAMKLTYGNVDHVSNQNRLVFYVYCIHKVVSNEAYKREASPHLEFVISAWREDPETTVVAVKELWADLKFWFISFKGL